MQISNIFKTAALALTIAGLAACSSTSDTEEMPTETNNTAAADAAAAAARAEQQRLERERMEREREEQAALNTTVFYFDFDVAEFQPSDRETLIVHARNLASNPSRSVRLEGHADERGTREYNLALGERRANSIRDFLIVNGASRSQLETVSYGEEQPAVRGQTEDSYRQNRRVEIRPAG
ncbi:MAG: peptidoglycan-associated lipoprotein Pal [Pseudohongiella sp.]|uniref:peptidoglycan-associated lipoprotein Pal n=1 Tax=Pseudohongiella sp. TaxID=1979412 RepID=UPI00349FDCB0